MTRSAGLTTGLTVAGALAGSWYAVVGTGLDGPDLARFLAGRGSWALAAGLGWVMLAPLVLAPAALLVRRTPWPWVVACTLHLLVVVMLGLRLRHLVAAPVGLAGLLVVALGLASLVAATGTPRPGATAPPTTGRPVA